MVVNIPFIKENPMLYATLKNESYTPLFFLSSLGAGGLAVSFFMYLM